MSVVVPPAIWYRADMEDASYQSHLHHTLGNHRTNFGWSQIIAAAIIVSDRMLSQATYLLFMIGRSHLLRSRFDLARMQRAAIAGNVSFVIVAILRVVILRWRLPV